MSGHSKWSTIKHKKELKDQRRGKAFSKLAKLISIAAREGADPQSNFKLRLAVEKAKQANMPKVNIDRAIEKGSGGGGKENWEEVTYEGYGPEGVAVIVETITDNRNRTGAEIKNIFEKGGGSLASPGAVAYQFESKGMIILKKPAQPETAVLKIMDFGVEDVEIANGTIEVYTQAGDLDKVTKQLQEANFEVLEKELTLKPKTVVAITDKDKKEKILRFMEMLEGHDDVQKTFANFDFIT